MSNFETPQAEIDPTRAARMAMLKRFHILDTDRDMVFDGLAELAAALFDAPIAVVNFIADDRQWFKAEIGIGQRTLPLDVSICRIVLPERGVFVVPDLACDARFSGNPLVAVAEGLRFHAGVVLECDGVPFGTVCVLDHSPRPAGISDAQQRGLRALAVQVMAALERSAAAGRDRFKQAFSEALLARDDADDMMAVAARMIADHLGVAQVGFGVADQTQDFVTVAQEWNDGRMSSFAGHWRLDDFGPDRVKSLKAGKTLAIDDLCLADRGDSAPYLALGLRSVLAVPLVRSGTFVATLYAHHSEARAWSADEIALVRDCASRLWNAVMRGRSDADTKARSRELTALIGTAPIGFAYFDRQRRFLRINAELAAINGLPAADHIGALVDDLLPTTAAVVGPIIDRVFATGESAQTIEVTVTPPLQPEAERHFMASYFPVRDDNGHVTSVGAWVVEITERKRAENAQRASEVRLRRAQDLGGIGSWEWNHATGEGQVSPSYRTLHGLSGQATQVSNAELRAVMHQGDHAVFRALVEKGLASGERMVFEYRVMVPGDPGYRWIRGTGQRVGLTLPPVTAGIVEDVTLRRANHALVKSQSEEITAIFDAAPVACASLIARCATSG